MLYELDKIDSMRYDNKETVTVYIFDMDMWDGKHQEHVYYTKKKITKIIMKYKNYYNIVQIF